MDLNFMVSKLHSKDTSQAFEVLKELEKASDNSNLLYPYIYKFMEMIYSEKYVIRVRGFRLFCKQARWDIDNIINKNINDVLIILDDDKPTAVRQALAALQDVVTYKKELIDIIKDGVLAIDCYRYKDTMHGLILKDIAKLMNVMEEIR